MKDDLNVERPPQLGEKVFVHWVGRSSEQGSIIEITPFEAGVTYTAGWLVTVELSGRRLVRERFTEDMRHELSA